MWSFSLKRFYKLWMAVGYRQCFTHKFCFECPNSVLIFQTHLLYFIWKILVCLYSYIITYTNCTVTVLWKSQIFSSSSSSVLYNNSYFFNVEKTQHWTRKHIFFTVNTSWKKKKKILLQTLPDQQAGSAQPLRFPLLSECIQEASVQEHPAIYHSLSIFLLDAFHPETRSRAHEASWGDVQKAEQKLLYPHLSWTGLLIPRHFRD